MDFETGRAHADWVSHVEVAAQHAVLLGFGEHRNSEVVGGRHLELSVAGRCGDVQCTVDRGCVVRWVGECMEEGRSLEG